MKRLITSIALGLLAVSAYAVQPTQLKLDQSITDMTSGRFSINYELRANNETSGGRASNHSNNNPINLMSDLIEGTNDDLRFLFPGFDGSSYIRINVTCSNGAKANYNYGAKQLNSGDVLVLSAPKGCK